MERDPFESERSVNQFGYRWNPDPRSRNLLVLLKRGWNEIPVVMFSGIFFLIGTGCIAYGVLTDDGQKGWQRKYKARYTVYRDCDPRLKDVKYTN